MPTDQDVKRRRIGVLAVLLASLITAGGMYVLLEDDSILLPLVMCAIPATLLPIVYAALTRFYRHVLGRILFTFMALLAIMIDVTLVNMVAIYPYQYEVARVLYLAFGMCLWALITYIVMIQWYEREMPDAHTLDGEDPHENHLPL